MFRHNQANDDCAGHSSDRRRPLATARKVLAGGVALGSMLAVTVGAASAGASTATATAYNPEVVWRAALEIWVGNVDYAGTDGDVYVEVNGSRTYLNKAHDDLQRGTPPATYKLDLANIGSTSSIDAVTIGNSSNDGVCVERFFLYVNDRPYVESGRIDTPGVTAECKWIDGDDGGPDRYSFTKQAHPASWKGVSYDPPAKFMYGETVESTIEDIVGDAIYPHTSLIGWGPFGAPVQVKPAGTELGVSNAMEIDLDLAYEFGFAPEFDLDLLAQFTCAGQDVTVSVQPAPGESDPFSLGNSISDAIDRQLELSLENRLKALGTSCSSMTVTPDSDGAVHSLRMI